MLIFPPTTTTDTLVIPSTPLAFQTVQESTGFQFIGRLGRNPRSEGAYTIRSSTSINIGQITLQIVAVSLIAAALWFVFKSANAKRPKSKAAARPKDMPQSKNDWIARGADNLPALPVKSPAPKNSKNSFWIQSVPQSKDTPAKDASNGRDGPRGVGGWLLVFGILNLLGGLLSVYIVATIKYHGTNFYDVLICILQLITGIVVLSGSMGGRSWARYYLVFFTLYGIMHPVADLMYSKDFVSDGSKSIGAILVYIVYFAIWWAYFNRSKRVLNTYGPE